MSITALAGKLREDGKDIIVLSAGEPDFPTPEHIQEAGCEAIRGGDTKYTAVDGVPSLKTAIQEKFRRDNDLDFQLNEILVSSGAKQSCYNACQALLEAGDEVIIPAPYWVSYPEMVRLAGGVPVFVETEEKNGWKMTAGQFEEAMTPKTKMVIINSPSNPSGAVLDDAEFIKIAELCHEHGIIVLADECYCFFLYEGRQPFSIASRQDLRDNIVVVGSVSKTYAMTGWRLGWTIAPRDLAHHLGDLAQGLLFGVTQFVQDAAVVALTQDLAEVEAMRETFKQRRDVLCAGLARLGWEVTPPRAGMFLWAKIPEAWTSRMDSIEFATMLLKHGDVAVSPGAGFGPAGEGFLRLSLVENENRLRQAVRQISRCLSEREAEMEAEKPSHTNTP